MHLSTNPFRRLRSTLFLFLLFAGSVASAADEIQVYTDDINAPGEFGLELHSNYVMKGRREQAFDHELAPHHTFNLTPEFSYGVTQRFELGLYLPFAYDSDNHSAVTNGIKFRTKWLDVEKERSLYYGVNFELAYNAKRADENRWTGEVRPIIGLRGDQWSFAFNPILDLTFSGHDHRPLFEPAFKINRKISGDFEVGVEHYASLGQLNNLLGARDQGHATFIVSDFKIGEHDVNVGLGRGWRNSDEQWTIKLIIGGIRFLE